MSESIGMMDKAYFVGKVAILQWFNELLDVSDPPQHSAILAVNALFAPLTPRLTCVAFS